MGELNEFEQEVVREFSQSATPREVWLKFCEERGSVDSIVTRFFWRKQIKQFHDESVETKVYQVQVGSENRVVAQNSCRALFRAKAGGVVYITIQTNSLATIVVSRKKGEKYRKELTVYRKESKHHEQITIPFEKRSDNGTYDYFVSVWQKEPVDITCRFSTCLDRHEHALGGIWEADSNVAGPDKRVSFIWYVPREHVSSLIDAIDSLDDQYGWEEAVANMMTGIGLISGVVCSLGLVGGTLGAVAATPAFVLGSLTVGIVGAVSTIVSWINEYTEELKAAIIKTAGKDTGNLSYGAYYNGIKLTVYEGDDISDYKVEPWNSSIMEGASAQKGRFLPASDNTSEYALVVNITKNQRNLDD